MRNERCSTFLDLLVWGLEQAPTVRARAIVEHIARIIVARHGIGAADVDARAVVGIVQWAVVDRRRIGAAIGKGFAESAVHVGGRVVVGAGRVGAADKVASVGVDVGKRVIIHSGRVRATQSGRNAHGGLRRRRIVVGRSGVHAAREAARAIIYVGNRTVVDRAWVSAAFVEHRARAVVIGGELLKADGGGVGAASNDARIVLHDCPRPVIESRADCAAIRWGARRRRQGWRRRRRQRRRRRRWWRWRGRR